MLWYRDDGDFSIMQTVGTLSLVLNLLWQFASLLLHLFQIYTLVSLDKHEGSQSPILVAKCSQRFFIHPCMSGAYPVVLWAEILQSYFPLSCFIIYLSLEEDLWRWHWRTVSTYMFLFASSWQNEFQIEQSMAQTWIHIPSKHIYKEKSLNSSGFYRYLAGVGGKSRVCSLQVHFYVRAQCNMII